MTALFFFELFPTSVPRRVKARDRIDQDPLSLSKTAFFAPAAKRDLPHSIEGHYEE